MSEWTDATLGELATFTNGFAFGPAHWGTQGLPIIRIEQMLDPQADVDRFDGPVPEHIRVNSGNLLMSWSGTIEIVRWDRGPALVNQHLFKIEPLKHVDSSFLFHMLRANLVPLAASSHGTTMKHITRSDLLSFPVRLPTLTEQRRIGRILDVVDERVRATVRKMAKQRFLEQSLALSASVLADESSPFIALRDLLEHHASGPSPTCEERQMRGQEWGLLKTTAVTWDGWNPKAHKVPPRAYWSNRQIEVRRGDVVVTKAGPRHRVGVVAFVDEAPARLMVSGKLVLLRFRRDLVVPRFLAALLSGEKAQRYLDRRTSGMAASQENFSNETLLGCALRLPSYETQLTMANALEAAAVLRRRIADEIDRLRAIRFGLASDLLTGRVRAVRV